MSPKQSLETQEKDAWVHLFLTLPPGVDNLG
jgi:hypothetical protein